MEENTVYDERTTFQCNDDEATRYETPQPHTPEETPVSKQPKKNSPWKSAACGLGSGILLGAATTLFSSATPAENVVNAENGENAEGTENEVSENAEPTSSLSDGMVPVAESVQDDMSFGEAFAAARAEVGPGGVFVWNGNAYSTYTAEEWGSMSAEQREEYSSHVHVDTSSNEDLQVGTQQSQQQNVEDFGGETPEIEVTPGEPEDEGVEILGVVYDDASGMTVGMMSVNNQEVSVVDIDSDGSFDIMSTDANGDNQISQDEFYDISEEGLTVDDLGGITHETDYANNSDDILDGYGSNDVYDA